jgi:TRAP transporter TAXI family solute receptor
MERFLRIVVLFSILAAGATPPVRAQSARADPASPENAIKERKNAGTVGLACGQLGAAYPSLAQDIAKVLDDGDILRVIPMITYGSVGNIEDLLYLRNVDVAFTKADNFEYFNKSMKINLKNKIHYITRLYDAELHILVRPEIQRLEDLRGKKVNIGVAGNAAHTTVPIVMQALGIDVEMIKVDHAIGLEMMKKGEISAAMRVGGKPMDTFTKVPENSGFHFLSISTSQYAEHFIEKYVLGKLTNKDYPNLIAEGETITTVAVPEILAVYNWPKGTDRYQRVEKFIISFFKNFNKLQEGPFHEKWKDVNLAATIPGWTRSEIAERIVKEMGANAPGASVNQTVAGAGAAKTPKDREALFQEFMQWQNRADR